jgi:hypothetical protein
MRTETSLGSAPLGGWAQWLDDYRAVRPVACAQGLHRTAVAALRDGCEENEVSVA